MASSGPKQALRFTLLSFFLLVLYIGPSIFILFLHIYFTSILLLYMGPSIFTLHMKWRAVGRKGAQISHARAGGRASCVSVHCVLLCGRTRLCVRARFRINYETMRIYNRISTRYVVSFLIISLSLSLSRARARALSLSLCLDLVRQYTAPPKMGTGCICVGLQVAWTVGRWTLCNTGLGFMV